MEAESATSTTREKRERLQLRFNEMTRASQMTTAIETTSVILNYIGRFGSPEVIHTDQGSAFHNDLVTELLRLGGIQQSFATAYSRYLLS